MNASELELLLSEVRPVLIEAICTGVQEHVESLRCKGIDFYAYALLPGEVYDLHDIVAVTNSLTDVAVPIEDSQYSYYRFCVDEWKHWHSDGFAAANTVMLEANQRFAAAHAGVGYVMDDVQIAYANGLLDSILSGIDQAKRRGTFVGTDPFLAIWISDSGSEIIAESVKRLNHIDVFSDFMAEFG